MTPSRRKDKKVTEPLTGCLKIGGQAWTKDEGAIGFHGNFRYKAQSLEVFESSLGKIDDWQLFLKESVLKSLVDTFVQFDLKQILDDADIFMAAATVLANETTEEYGFKIECIDIERIKEDYEPRKK